jgi:hypothetical protein
VYCPSVVLLSIPPSSPKTALWLEKPIPRPRIRELSRANLIGSISHINLQLDVVMQIFSLVSHTALSGLAQPGPISCDAISIISACRASDHGCIDLGMLETLILYQLKKFIGR